MDIKAQIGEIIRERRRAKHWTQEKLATEAGINTRFLQKIEAGDRAPSLTTIFRLAKAFNIGPDRLIMPVWKDWSAQ